MRIIRPYPMPKVTAKQRAMALLMRRHVAPVQRRGVDLGARVGFRLQARILASWKSGREKHDYGYQAVRETMDEAIPLLASASTISHLVGIQMSRSFGTLALAGYGDAIAVLKARLEIPKAELEKLTHTYNARAIETLRGSEARIETRIQETILMATSEGATTKTGTKMLGEAFHDLGIVPNNSFSLENLFRTQTQIAYSAGQWQSDQDPAIQEILWGYRYATVGDDRVREEHIGLEGTTAPSDDPIWDEIWTPNGYSCRCTCIPMFEEAETAYPPATIEVDGETVAVGPDKGFAYNPGRLLAA